MYKEIKLWEVVKTESGSQLRNIPAGSLSELSNQKRFEEDLRDWIINDPSIVSDDLIIIGKEIESIDLLGFNHENQIVVIETKRDDPRDAVKQAIDYASLITQKNISWLKEKAEEKGFPVTQYEQFDKIHIENPKIYIVGTMPNEKEERMVRFLSEYDLDIELVVIRYHRDPESKKEYLTRTYLLSDDVRKELSETKKSSERQKWDASSYFEKMSEIHTSVVVGKIRYLFELVKKSVFLRVRFGTGKNPSIMVDSNKADTLLHLYSDGFLVIWDYAYSSFPKNKLEEYRAKLDQWSFKRMKGYYRCKMDEVSEEILDTLVGYIVTLIQD